MTPRVIAVTGATGFTGPFVVRALRRRFPAAQLRCLVRPSSNVDGLLATGIETAAGDLRDVASLRAAFDGADTLVNIASLGVDWIDPLFEAVRASTLRRGVFIGTTAMLTRLPVSSKSIRERGESLVRSSGLDWTIVRPTMIYGTPADRNIARLITFVLRSPVIPVVAARARQQPVHVEDVAMAVAAAVETDASIGNSYNIAGGAPLTLEDMVRIVIRTAGIRRLVVRVPTAPLRAAAALHGMVSSKPFMKPEQLARLHEDKAFDYEDAARDLGYAPRSFEEGVAAELAMIRGAS